MAGNIFNKILVSKPQYSYFDLSHDAKLSFKMGKIVPVLCQEAIPGDKFHLKNEAMFRMMPMLAPIMHKVDATFHYFFVPNRILWPNWEKFITGGDDTTDLPPAFPTLQLTAAQAAPSSLADYLGLPTDVDLNQSVNALPFAAYHRIWFDYYRDQNLQDEEIFQLVDGDQDATTTAKLEQLRNRAWEHDYFTSCLPFAQKGDAVELPLDFQDVTVKFKENQGPSFIRRPAGNLLGGDNLEVDSAGRFIGRTSGGTDFAMLDPNGGLYVDGDDISVTTTINDLRTATALQRWLEKNARAGSRMVEFLRAHFNVKSSDARLQRPEYLGGSFASMAISEVLQTSSSDTTSPQANMAGHGISVTGSGEISHFCEEHGFIMCLLSVKPKTAYYQGLPKIFDKFERTDYYFPDFAYLGEQEVKMKELYYDENDLQNEETFGYLPRYAEYRYNFSRVHGQMRDTLEFWHMGRKFTSRPVLNASFVESNPTTRIFAVDDPAEDQITAHIVHKILARRPIPQYGTPGTI